ncbi:MltA domain-containing protein [Thiotrichales bacterium 19S3-7]|nr:MltA domain-containing protein [Thiotrichales bacterium 19S3-7]MCF6802481.1 MltA domain-containing protein [Thiotrichales bacterium 19S3-11]
MEFPLKVNLLRITTSVLALSYLSSSLLIANSQPSYQAVKFSQLPGWQQGDQSNTINALKASCKKMLSTKATSTNDRTWNKTCRFIVKLPKDLTNQQARYNLSKYFTAYEVSFKGSNTGLFTGYYEPIFKGSLTKTNYYGVPIYKRPKDLIVQKSKSGKYQYGKIINGKFQRYYSREEIAKNNFFTQKDIIAWVHSRVDRTFLQIQGSGRIEFADGSTILVSYNGQNGWPYRPIGRYLVQQGELTTKNVSMQSIRKWLDDHPSRVNEVLNYDPSFVFFKVVGHGNLLGAEGTTLTPGYSIAVDWRYIDYGTPIWLNSYYPTPNGTKTLNRLLIAQDTGGAIRGPIRGDIFWGSSANAQYTAGHMKSQGKIWLLLPNDFEI